ncbi:RRM_XMAS2 and SAC3_GANP domain-containing protein xmas isoform X2 [Calliopsis andreniformis]
MENITSKTFIFSEPNILNPPKTINSEVILEQVTDASICKNLFTFTAPTAVSQPNIHNIITSQSNICEKQYKPKILRNTYKPAVNVFVQALKDTAMFEQLKKNSRSQVTKIKPENSITCSNVPQLLLSKVAAKEYFMLFGNLLKIAIRPRKQIITVTYATKEEANVAYNKSGEYLGEKFNVEWTKSCASLKSPTKKKDMQKNIVSNFLKSSDKEIKSELDAMMNLEYNLHSNYRDNLDGTMLKRNKIIQPKSTKRIEKSSVKPDKIKPDNQISDLLPNATLEELQNIICQPAYTSEDKYKVLEARDRLMRMKQVKSHTLAAAKVMIGTCPDMCPEKERLMRESKRQVALYEQLESNEYGINHAIAVKQYSRSSADQEEPMAHELRPVTSLKMTMSYLLHEIANLCDQQGTNLGEWYHFLWDRTRGIRKDITQQELCCTDSVELVEQCARFHIVCSERLCAEEASVFDKKINSDNLTKCLQSLKYMYHDLRVKGINCKNEPEFRAYIILLNLNNGNFMWDLQRLPKSIQKSPEVQFALEVYSALESNNYYKFFKLVHKTTYLNACILLRYFNQVRLKALSVMVKAYCRTASTAYPLYELIDILGFEDEAEAIYFCEQVGLSVSKDELHVLLNRQNFTLPMLNIKQNRACNLIESKRTMQRLSIGECIAGGRMPEKTYKYHKPHNSFDSHGYLLPSSINAEDQSKTITFVSTDLYEFKDEDTMEIKESISVSKKSQNKNETAIITDDTNIFKSITTTAKTDTSVPFILKPQTTISGAQTNVNKSLKLKTEAEKEPKPFSFTQKQISTSNVMKNNEPSALGSAFITTTNLKASNVFSKSFDLVSKNDTVSPFATAVNKSIFSGSAQGNIFQRNLTPSTIFSSRSSNTQSISQSSNISNAMTFITDSKLRETQDSSAFPGQTKKQSIKKIDTEKLKSDEQEHTKRMEQINETAECILNALEVEVIETCCSDIVKEEISTINIYNALSKDINDEILNEITYEICDNILKEEIFNTQKLYEISLKIKNRIIIKYFNIWKSNVLKKRQQRKVLDGTPVWLQKYSSKQCAKLLYTKEQDLVIQNMCKRQNMLETTKSYIDSLAPIEIIIYIGIKENLKFLETNMESNYYWKLVISWPDLHNKLVLWHHKKVVNQYLCPNDYTIEPIIKLYQPNEIETLHICIRHFEGLISEHNLLGSDAFLFITTTSEESKIIIKRLTKTILSKDRLMPIPLVLIVLGDVKCEIQDKEVTATLEKMLKSGYLSAYTIMHEKCLTQEAMLNLIQSALLWLSINKPAQNPLQMDCLQKIYDICLTEELWLR